MDPRFAVLEPAIADTLLQQISKETLFERVEQRDPDASKFVLHFGLERSIELLRRLASQRFQIDFTRFENETPEQVEQRWRTQWETEFIPKLISNLRTDPQTIQTFELLVANESTHAVMKSRRSLLIEWLNPKTDWEHPSEVLSILIENARVQGGGTAKNWPSPEVHEEIKRGLTFLRDAVKKLGEQLLIEESDLKLAAEVSCRALRLARRTSDEYQKAKQAQGVLDFDDLLLKARDLLRDHSEVRKRVSAGIQLLMVDEFQDTDPVQADVVRMLCGSALTKGRLFLVGDAKQSIYRFRRADPGVFAQLRQEIPKAGRLPLNVNFRSQPAVLNFVNHLFAPAMGDSYEALAPFDTVQHSPTPSIEFLFATSDGHDADNPDDGITGDSFDDDSVQRNRTANEAATTSSDETDAESDGSETESGSSRIKVD
ncbi:MAG: hypothetical protein FJ267_15315, partial [Planctomycetes bacterium]|nr:hypothetical protein [Planctomycetota bacterium]